MHSNIPDRDESRRLDELTQANALVLNRLHGEQLDAALAPEKLRRAMTDQSYRMTVLEHVHPDDLLEALKAAGLV